MLFAFSYLAESKFDDPLTDNRWFLLPHKWFYQSLTRNIKTWYLNLRVCIRGWMVLLLLNNERLSVNIIYFFLFFSSIICLVLLDFYDVFVFMEDNFSFLVRWRQCGKLLWAFSRWMFGCLMHFVRGKNFTSSRYHSWLSLPGYISHLEKA